MSKYSNKIIKRLLLIFVFLFHFVVEAVSVPKMKELITEYSSSKEMSLGWSAAVYAIENDYDDEVINFYLDNYGIGSCFYVSKLDDWQIWNVDKSDIVVKNILFTCIRKGKKSFLQKILSKNKPKDPNIFEYSIHYTHQHPKPKSKKRRILNFLIEEIDNPLEYIEIFLKMGADVNQVENWEELDLHCKAKKSCVTSPLGAAVHTGKIDLIKYMLEKKADPNKYGIIGSKTQPQLLFLVPIEIAINQNRLDILKLLLENGANIYGSGRNQSPLINAVQSNNIELVLLLVNHGADPLHRIANSCSPFELAILLNRLEILDLFEAVMND